MEKYLVENQIEIDNSIFNGDIIILGPRPSGKLTFLVALACFNKAIKNGDLVQSVKPFNQEAEGLIGRGENILLQGGRLSPMTYDNIDFLPYYNLEVILKLFGNLPKVFCEHKTHLNISCRLYPGEFFEGLCDRRIEREIIHEYLDDLACINQVILMIDVLSSQQDQEYANRLVILEQELRKRIKPQNLADYRIAVVFSKFDMPEAWVYRNDLDQFINLKYSQVKSTLNQWHESWNCSIEYFACSAYGMVGEPPEANAVKLIEWGGEGIKYPDKWKPFGLVSPIYWLLTGKRDKRLD